MPPVSTAPNIATGAIFQVAATPLLFTIPPSIAIAEAHTMSRAGTVSWTGTNGLARGARSGP